MELDFFAILNNPKNITLYDITVGELPGDVETMNLHVVSSKLTTSYDFNLVEYLRSNRISDELFIINPTMLGLSPEEIFRDGVYHLTYTINGHYIKTNKFLIFTTIKTLIDKLLVDSEYKVDVGTYNMTYVKDDVNNKYDIEKIRYVMTLYDKLLSYTQEPNEVEVNNLLDKINRLLTIINNI